MLYSFFTVKERMTILTQLRNLRRGRLFDMDGIKGKLVYCNSCRARVRLEPQTVRILDRTFTRDVESDWAPTTLVRVTNKERP